MEDFKILTRCYMEKNIVGNKKKTSDGEVEEYYFVHDGIISYQEKWMHLNIFKIKNHQAW